MRGIEISILGKGRRLLNIMKNSIKILFKAKLLLQEELENLVAKRTQNDGKHQNVQEKEYVRQLSKLLFANDMVFD